MNTSTAITIKIERRGREKYAVQGDRVLGRVASVIPTSNNLVKIKIVGAQHSMLGKSLGLDHYQVGR